MKFEKENVFADFIAAAEWLFSSNYTCPHKLVINGRSNGGLLIGAIMTKRPDLCKVAILSVGVMDMLRFQKFTIGLAWQAEYGSSDDATYFPYLLGYSPLHNLKAGVQYPATLVTTADHDDRVVPAHSFKFIATLQDKQVGDNPTFIRIEKKSAWHPLERLEFYDDLRMIEQKIILFNSRVPESRQLALDILGTEPPQDTKGAYTRMDRKENFEFFCKERDRLSELLDRQCFFAGKICSGKC